NPRKSGLSDRPKDGAGKATDDADHQSLSDIDSSDLPGAAADTLHKRDVRHLLPQVALHRGTHAESSNDECNQAHKRKESSGSIQSARQLGIRFSEIGDAGPAAKDLSKCLSGTRRILRGGQFQENTFGDPAAGHDDAGAGNAFACEKHARTEREARSHAVWLFHDPRRDSKRAPADAEGVTELGVDPKQ